MLKTMLGIVFSIEICTRHRMSFKNVDLNICAHTWHSVSVMGHKQGFDLAVPELIPGSLRNMFGYHGASKSLSTTRKKRWDGLMDWWWGQAVLTISKYRLIIYGCFTLCSLKGEHDDYTWGYGQNPLDYPLPWVPFLFRSADPIFSNRQNNPRQIPYFSYF